MPVFFAAIDASADIPVVLKVGPVLFILGSSWMLVGKFLSGKNCLHAFPQWHVDFNAGSRFL